MFTGFASENTPAIQVWDFINSFNGQILICLTDDCAPIQYFRTGANTDFVKLYLPSSPIEGKQIKIVNSKYGTSSQPISIYSSDSQSGGSNNEIYRIGQGQTLDLCYSKNIITNIGGNIGTGWIALNQGSANSRNYYSIALGGSRNEATDTYCAVIGGTQNTASSGSSVVAGGTSNTASGGSAFVGGGTSNTASGGSAFVGSGFVNLANGSYSAVIGGSYGTTRSIEGNTVLPASATPIQAKAGVQQSGLLVLGVATTDATATRLRSNTSAAATNNQVILPNNSAYVFQGTCIANVTGGSTTSGWEFQGVIKRGANAASTTLVAAVTPTVIAQDALASTWVLAITADTTNGGIAVTVTGAAATTIRWVSRIETTEVTF